MHFLVAESETAEQRATRRDHVGQSAGETYADTLHALAPEATIELVAPSDPDADLPDVAALAGYDAVFVSGSPIHVYDDTAEARRQIGFMRDVFASGTPSFGSCAGLQLAVAAAGGEVRKAGRHEAGFARRLTRTEAGRDHPLLAGRGLAWDAAAIHGDEVARLPEGAVCLATNAVTGVQAAEIRHAGGVFWGVQYHPELSLAEIGAALRRDAATLVEAGLAPDEAVVEEQAALFDALDATPGRVDLRWRLGVDAEVADRCCRTRELANFIGHLVVPTRARRLAERTGANELEPA